MAANSKIGYYVTYIFSVIIVREFTLVACYKLATDYVDKMSKDEQMLNL